MSAANYNRARRHSRGRNAFEYPVILRPMSTDDFRSNTTVQIDYSEFETDDEFVHQGRYVPDCALPFQIEDCAGTWFDIDGTRCELVGDLGGHAVYRRARSKSTLRTMDWEDFVVAYERGRITLT